MSRHSRWSRSSIYWVVCAPDWAAADLRLPDASWCSFSHLNVYILSLWTLRLARSPSRFTMLWVYTTLTICGRLHLKLLLEWHYLNWVLDVQCWELKGVKWIVHTKIKFVSSFTHPHVVPNLYDLLMNIFKHTAICYIEQFYTKTSITLSKSATCWSKSMLLLAVPQAFCCKTFSEVCISKDSINVTVQAHINRNDLLN